MILICGRYRFAPSKDELLERYALLNYMEEYDSLGEVFPASSVPVVMPSLGGGRNINNLKWGFAIPGIKRPIINARGETVHQKTLFRGPLYSRRCLIPADGFFEWKKENTKGKTKHMISLINGGLFSMAGLYREFLDENGAPFTSFVIITTRANEIIAPIHNRMPVIIPMESENTWLDLSVNDTECLKSLLEPCAPNLLKVEKVL